MQYSLNSKFEILPGERGKIWKVPETFTVSSREGKKLTVPDTYFFDRYTIAPDLKDWKPPAIHDYAYDLSAKGSGRKWDDETPITRRQADRLLLDTMEASWDLQTRLMADIYHLKVRQFGWIPWYWGIWKAKIKSKIFQP